MPHLTGKVFKDLLIWMVIMGMMIGVVLPLTEVLLGEPLAHVVAPLHLLVCVAAGCLLGLANYFVAQKVIRPVLKRVVSDMHRVEDSFREASFTGEWDQCREEIQTMAPAGNDEIGATTLAFNQLVRELIRVNTLNRTSSDLAKQLNSYLELGDMGRMAMNFLIKHTDAAAVCILAMIDDNLSVVGSHAISEPARLLESDDVMKTLQQNEIQIARVAPNVVIDRAIVAFQPQQLIYLPISSHDVVLGVVVLASDTMFSKDAMWILRAFQTSMGLALSNALSHERLHKLATLDPLTGIFNRRQGMKRLREEFLTAAQLRGSLGVLMFDLDHFKRVNDTYGHSVGDQVLVDVTRAAGKALRDTDVLIRAGGEEFMVVLPGVSAVTLERVGERLREAIANTVIFSEGHEVRVTVSVGLASYRPEGTRQEEDLIKQADRALYRAKETGRNRVVAAEMMDNENLEDAPVPDAQPVPDPGYPTPVI